MVNYNDIKVGETYWTMRGKKPALLEVSSKVEIGNPDAHGYYKVWLIDKCKRMLYDRRPEELFRDYLELRDHIFPIPTPIVDINKFT